MSILSNRAGRLAAIVESYYDGLSASLLLIVVMVTGMFLGCSREIPAAEKERVHSGAEILRDSGFKSLADLRVGLITNQTAVVDSNHVIDLLNNEPSVTLVALFGPEHGLRGQAEAGAAVEDGVDAESGVPVYSLYGSSDAPSLELLSDLDVLVFDIQDIGARFYTYIATMGRSMQAAARAGIPFVVLDRPNPLGGAMIDGYVLDMEFSSGVGPYPIPVQHGLTVGELATMIKGERWLEDIADVDLRVIKMTGWSRDMMWPETGLPWIATSPNIPTFETALVYVGTCFFEAIKASEGRGTPAPFLTLGAPWLDADAAVANLRSLKLQGVAFNPGFHTPLSIPGVADHPLFEDQDIKTILIDVTDYDSYRPLETGIAVLKTVIDLAPDSSREDLFNLRWMGLLSGGNRLADALAQGNTAEEIVSSWTDEVDKFKLRSAAYLLYD